MHLLTRTTLSTIKVWDQLRQRHVCAVFARLLCSAGITNENEFHNSSSPTLCASNDVTSGHAHLLCSEIWLTSQHYPDKPTSKSVEQRSINNR